MPPNPTWSLQKAIHEALTNNTNLTTLLNGPNIHDHVPNNQQPPYIALADITTTNLTDDTHEHHITLNIWSDNAGRKQLTDITSEINTTLHDQPILLENHTLINLQHLSTETTRNKNTHLYQASTRYRAVTE